MSYRDGVPFVSETSDIIWRRSPDLRTLAQKLAEGLDELVNILDLLGDPAYIVEPDRLGVEGTYRAASDVIARMRVVVNQLSGGVEAK